MPKPVRTTFAPLAATAMSVPLEEFRKLTRIPIIIYYGDYIADEPSSAVGPDKWRSEYEMARQFAEAVNRHGGDVTVEIGRAHVELQSLMRHSSAVFCLKKNTLIPSTQTIT